MRSTTILCVRKDGKVAMGGDGQVTVGETVMKANANKVRALKGGKMLAGFAGAAADGITLMEKLEEKLERYPGNLARAAVELAKDWRSDRVLRRLEALLVVADGTHGYVISGSGELIEPDDGILAIGSGGPHSGRRAAVARGAAAAEDRGGAGSLHRGPESRQEGRRNRGAEPLAPRPGARRDPGRDPPQQHHHDRTDGGGEDGDRAPAGAARRGALRQSRSLEVHRGRLRRPRRGVDDSRAGGRVDQHGAHRAGRGRVPAGRGARGGAAAGSAASTRARTTSTIFTNSWWRFWRF